MNPIPKPEFTPGPWHNNREYCEYIYTEQSVLIAQAFAGDCDPSDRDRILLANAKLVASAPKLFTACAAALEALRNPEVGDTAEDEQGPSRLEDQLETALKEALGL